MMRQKPKQRTAGMVIVEAISPIIAQIGYATGPIVVQLAHLITTAIRRIKRSPSLTFRSRRRTR